MIDILEEQNDLNEKIMAVEKERMEAMASLLYSKIEVAKEFAETKQIYKDMISNEEIGEFNLGFNIYLDSSLFCPYNFGMLYTIFYYTIITKNINVISKTMMTLNKT